MKITRKAAAAIVTITFSLFAFSVAPAHAGVQPFLNPAINSLNSNQYLSELRRLAPKEFAQMTKPSLVLVGKDACKIFNANNGTTGAFLDTKNALIKQGWNPKMARSIALAATKYLCDGEFPESSPVPNPPTEQTADLVRVPLIVGMLNADAEWKIYSAGLGWLRYYGDTVNTLQYSNINRCIITEQKPAAGTLAKRGSRPAASLVCPDRGY